MHALIIRSLHADYWVGQGEITGLFASLLALAPASLNY